MVNMPCIFEGPVVGVAGGPAVPSFPGRPRPRSSGDSPGTMAERSGVPRGLVAMLAKQSGRLPDPGPIAVDVGPSSEADEAASARASASQNSTGLMQLATTPQLDPTQLARPTKLDPTQSAVAQQLDPTQFFVPQMEAVAMQQKALNGIMSANNELQQQLAIQEATSAAQQAQFLQQHQFHSQWRVFESQRLAKGQSTGDFPTRFKDGFRPMQLCKKLFKFGQCQRGSDCTFAHAVDELHPASSDLGPSEEQVGTTALADQQTPTFENTEPTRRMKKKREMCHRLVNGGCLLGKECMFAHTEDELGTVGLVITDRVKTQICRFWESGKCIYGKYCVNAHGMDEVGKLKPPEEFCPPSKSYKRGDT